MNMGVYVVIIANDAKTKSSAYISRKHRVDLLN